MTNEQILKKAIAKAVKNGYKATEDDVKNLMKTYELYPQLLLGTIIFSHSFAKAFWGDRKIRTIISFKGGTKEEKWETNWKHHLQQMVLEENPLKYISKHL